jgi:hypothetical protein
MEIQEGLMGKTYKSEASMVIHDMASGLSFRRNTGALIFSGFVLHS